MNKNTRNTVIFSIIFVGGLILIGVLYYIFSFRTVTFDIVPEDINAVTIYSQNEQIAARLSQDGSVRLQPGDYDYVVENDRYTDTPTTFTVTDNANITINPAFSESHRREILETENPAIIDLITKTYPNISTDFTIETGRIYQQGGWYATTLTQHSLPGGQQGDIYRMVLQKVDNEWQIAAEPEIVLSATDYPDIPYDILKDINAR